MRIVTHQPIITFFTFGQKPNMKGVANIFIEKKNSTDDNDET
jgi:hypothetical protein